MIIARKWKYRVYSHVYQLPQIIGQSIDKIRATSCFVSSTRPRLLPTYEVGVPVLVSQSSGMDSDKAGGHGYQVPPLKYKALPGKGLLPVMHQCLDHAHFQFCLMYCYWENLSDDILDISETVTLSEILYNSSLLLNVLHLYVFERLKFSPNTNKVQGSLKTQPNI